MDRDSESIIADHFLHIGGGVIALLIGFSMVIWGWGLGTVGGLALMAGGVGFPLRTLYEVSNRQPVKVTRGRERHPSNGYEIRSSYRSPRR